MNYCNGKRGTCDRGSCVIGGTLCEHYDGTGSKTIQTNADRIRAMSDEELAKFHYGSGAPYCKKENPRDCTRQKYVDGLTPCEQCYLQWLRQPVEGGAENA